MRLYSHSDKISILENFGSLNICLVLVSVFTTFKNERHQKSSSHKTDPYAKTMYSLHVLNLDHSKSNLLQEVTKVDFLKELSV